MLKRILAAALVAGVVAGLAAAVLQHFTTTPLILAAEVYEVAAAEAPRLWRADAGEARLFLVHAGEHSEAAWAPADGAPRLAFAALATVGAAFGFALILLSAMIFAGAPITARSGLGWGFVGFACAGLAPALGLGPELPGAAAGELVARQAWWIGTAAATAAGLWLALRVSSPPAIAVGVALILLPHVVGAPHPRAFASTVPAELAAAFAGASLAVQAVLWSLTGLAAGYAWTRGPGRPA